MLDLLTYCPMNSPHAPRPAGRETLITLDGEPVNQLASKALPPARPSAPVLAYDGDCGFYQTSVDRIQVLAAPSLNAVPVQFLPAEFMAPDLERLDREVLLLRGVEVPSDGGQALASGIDISACAHVGYHWVSRSRRCLPGGTPACAVQPHGA
ncbi:DUF393 domain-containing protein [Streptomyces asoensis]|uniref:DUF393 domain-containing protein n=1 Tax=Streptomyces asoensis TaxID=249586 RepID=UPI0033CAF874